MEDAVSENAESAAAPKDWAQEIQQVRERLEQLRDDVPSALIDDDDIKDINRFLSFMGDWVAQVRDKQSEVQFDGSPNA